VRFAYPGYALEPILVIPLRREVKYTVIPAKAGTQAVTASALSRHSSESWNPL